MVQSTLSHIIYALNFFLDIRKSLKSLQPAPGSLKRSQLPYAATELAGIFKQSHPSFPTSTYVPLEILFHLPYLA